MTVAAPKDGVTILAGETLTAYQFGPCAETHWFCRTCGCYTHHERPIAGREFGINVGGLEGVNPRDLDPVPWMDGVNYQPQAQEA